ncbi:hypothetical protein C2G38_2227537 [Gigaspora rosea]|uniref:Uncharacterized protein n=1 Tax=Gigaspora rosea TaxID=44941 RepID=A0A397U0K1_9GLOM|nr:hypothetical protein C2G38_2227537 [Gigaspora rosea]
MDNNIVRQRTSLPQCRAYNDYELLISHAINHYVKLGFNLSQGTDIESAIKGISGTRVAHLEPNRTKGTSNKKFSLPGNSNWRLEKLFPIQLSKLQKTEIIKPHSQFSDHSMTETDWHMPLPHISNKLKMELEKRNIDYKGLKRNELVDILQVKMTQEILSLDVNAVPIALKKECVMLVDQIRTIDRDKFLEKITQIDDKLMVELLLPAGWALKETQKFGIKGKGKRISKNVVPLLEAFFLARDANKSDRYTAKDMLNELHSMAREGILEDDEIPKLTTIANWISEYQKNTGNILQTNQLKHQGLLIKGLLAKLL